VKINPGLIAATSYSDKSVSRARSYSYACRSVNSDGMESADSNIAGAPKMFMNTSATVTHAGKVARIAAPGDVIKYDIDFANYGFGTAKNVSIVYGIPKGTTFIAGTGKCLKHKVSITYFDEKAGKWVDKVGAEGNISRVKFTLNEDVFPVAGKKDDTATLKVLVNY
jgi:uncharacterized repeat protein (TIGR01451 family)